MDVPTRKKKPVYNMFDNKGEGGRSVSTKD